MFIKLLKHEWKASRSTLSILALAALGMGLLATLDLRLFIAGIQNNTGTNPLYTMVQIAMLLLLAACFVGLVAYGIGTQLLLLYRFYKNKFTDEGYLTFTLPVKVTDIFWSSFVHMLIWLLISFAAILVVGFIFLLFGTATEGLVNLEFFDIIKRILTEMLDMTLWFEVFGTGQAIVIGILYVLILLLSPVYGLIIPMTCITIGAVLAKKHKILAAFGIYYGLNAVTGILGTVVGFVPNLLISAATQDVGALYITSLASSLLLTAALTVGGYFISIHLMKNKLNLP